MLLPFAIFLVLVKILPPWQEGKAHRSLRRLPCRNRSWKRWEREFATSRNE